MNADQFLIRHASLQDIDAICSIGRNVAFKVSGCINFYERAELEAWLSSSTNNVMLVVEDIVNDSIVGFCSCVILSNHWAMLDNIFVSVEHRRYGLAKKLLLKLQSELICWGLKYVSTLVRSIDSDTAS